MLTVIVIVVGLCLGASLGDSFGALTGALVAWLWMRSLRHQREIEALQQALQAARQVPPLPEAAAQGAAAAPASPPAAPTELDERGAVVAAPVPLPTAAASPVLAQSAQPAMASATPAAPEPLVDEAGQPGAATVGAPAAAPPARPGPLAPLKAWLLGGNTIVKAGVGILFIGLAFLAKYASEHVQLPVEFRLAGIAAVAVVLLGLGWRLRHKRAGYAQVLQGGAVAVLYLTLFVAFKFYAVLPVGPVFGLMVVVAALAAALAVLQDARALAVIGALGGFATPLLVSTGQGDHVALFSYYLVLDLGVAAVAWHKTWRSLNLVGFAGTFLVGSGWGVLKYQPEHYASSQAFLIAFFLLFVAIMLMPARKGHPTLASGSALAQRADGWVNGSLLFGLPTIVFALQYGLVRQTDYRVAISALAMAAFYVALASWMRAQPRLALTFEASLAIGTVFLTLVIPFALDARSTAGAWALEGAGLVWLGFRQARGLPRVFGYTLLLLAGGAMLVAQEHHGAPVAVFNAYLFNALLASAASLAAAYFAKRYAAPAPSDATAPASASASASASEGIAQPLLIGWATLWAVVAAGVQIDHFVDGRHELAAWLAAISALALVYTLLSLRLRWPMVAQPVMAHAPVLALGVASSAVLFDSPVQGGGAWAWPLALAVHGFVLWRAAPQWAELPRRAVHMLGALVLAALGALQGRAITAGWGDAASAWAWLGWLVVPAALLLLMPRAGTARRWPVSASPAAYQTAASAVLAAGLLLWTLLANAISDGSAQPLPHLPLLNPLDLGIAVALFASLAWLRSPGSAALLAGRPKLGIAGLSVAGFVWLNAILIRAFHHYGGVPFEVDAWMNSFAVQTGLTLLWTVTALVLMWGSARRAARAPWMVGAALLAAVVLKLLVIDLSGSGTVTRIVSFIGVGVLMLVIGYVAPWPGKKEEAGHAEA
ncbi:MAG TPA: DUF2339 domain-containing protein [Ideonella sp.]|nr:DUF2339 domain-containing protein [Ideonella sp.]